MSDVLNAPMFSCNGCGKQFKWKPAIAGKKAKCGCGATLQVPAEDPSQPRPVLGVEDESDLPTFGQNQTDYADDYALAPPPQPRAVMPVAAGVASPVLNRSGAAPLSYDRGKAKRQREFDSNASFWGAPSERTSPIWVLCIAAVIAFGSVLYRYGSPTVISVYSIAIVISVGFMIGGAFLTAMMTGINFGVLGLAIIRLGAICLVSEAIVGLVAVIGNPILVLLSYVVRLFVFWGMMMSYFELTVKEVFVTVIITFILRFVAGFLIAMMLISLL